MKHEDEIIWTDHEDGFPHRGSDYVPRPSSQPEPRKIKHKDTDAVLVGLCLIIGLLAIIGGAIMMFAGAELGGYIMTFGAFIFITGMIGVATA